MVGALLPLPKKLIQYCQNFQNKKRQQTKKEKAPNESNISFNEMQLYNKKCFIYIIGRHTNWTNVMFDPNIKQRQDFKNGGYVIKYQDMENKKHQGGYNVHQVIETFLDTIGANNENTSD